MDLTQFPFRLGLPVMIEEPSGKWSRAVRVRMAGVARLHSCISLPGLESRQQGLPGRQEAARRMEGARIRIRPHARIRGRIAGKATRWRRVRREFPNRNCPREPRRRSRSPFSVGSVYGSSTFSRVALMQRRRCGMGAVRCSTCGRQLRVAAASALHSG